MTLQNSTMPVLTKQVLVRAHASIEEIQSLMGGPLSEHDKAFTLRHQGVPEKSRTGNETTQTSRPALGC
jgi:hypothetical protein